MLPFSRHGRWEIFIGTVVLAALGLALGRFLHPWAAIAVAPVWLWLLAFFRDPQRPIPSEPNVYVSPADGTVSDITDLESEPLIGGGAAVRVGIFLSVFNVHVNRSPCDGIVTDIRYKKGKFVNAMHHAQASEQNESNTLVICDGAGKPIAVVRQIVGLIARRIVCEPQVGAMLVRGQRIGMIKFGSRTELTIPKSLNPKVRVEVGQKVRGARDIIASVSPG